MNVDQNLLADVNNGWCPTDNLEHFRQHGCRDRLQHSEAAAEEDAYTKSSSQPQQKTRQGNRPAQVSAASSCNMKAVDGVDANISARDVGEQVRRRSKPSVALVKLALKTHAAQT